MIEIPDYYERYKFYSKEDACIELQHNSEYSYRDAVKFVESLGLKVVDGGYVLFDPVFDDWRGYVSVEVGDD